LINFARIEVSIQASSSRRHRLEIRLFSLFFGSVRFSGLFAF
jgi:hypothetical protein